MSSRLVNVVLLKSVRGCGTYAQVVKVRPGYARYLVRTNTALIATEARIQETQDRIGILKQSHEEFQSQAAKNAKILNELRLFFVRSAGGQGRLYGSVSIGDIVSAINLKTGISLEKNMTSMVTIRVTGEHKVKIHLAEGIEAELTVFVTESDEAKSALLRQLDAHSKAENSNKNAENIATQTV